MLLDGWALLSRADLRAAEETFRRWANAGPWHGRRARSWSARTRGGARGQALVRWDSAGHAARELADRTKLRFPPASGWRRSPAPRRRSPTSLAQAELPAAHDLIGPVPVRDGVERVLVRVPRASGAELAAALKAAWAVRSARKAPDPVRVQLDPLEVL